jgi:hypothetical protein
MLKFNNDKICEEKDTKKIDKKKCNMDCDTRDPEKFDLKKCNRSLYKKITNNKEFLKHKRCLFMTFDEYTKEKVHINKNMCCRVFDSVNDKDIKSTIDAELANIKGMLRPAYLKIPLPIYMMFAKKLETVNNEAIFRNKYTVVLYIPNLYNYNGEGKEYTLFPSLDAFSKQNRWMELMTSKFSRYLDIVKIGSTDDRADKVKRKNYLRTDLTQTCFNMGCVASERETFIIPAYTTKDAELSVSVENISPYYPKRCLKTPYYNKHMMDFSPEDEIRFRGSVDVLSDGFDVNLHCSPENTKKYEGLATKDKDTFDNFLCKQIAVCKSYLPKEDPKKEPKEPKEIEYKNDYDRIICENTDKGKVETLLSDFYRKHIKSGTDKEKYSADYNNNILKELAYRKSRYPGPDNIQEVIFSMFRIEPNFFDENLFCYMPWGNILLKQDYVINEGEKLEIERVSFKSFNGVYEMKFNNDGYLWIYKDKRALSVVPKQSGSFKCYTRRVLKFETMNLNVYGYDEHNNYDLRGHISFPMNSMYASPASVILSNTGSLMIYDLGINNRTLG